MASRLGLDELESGLSAGFSPINAAINLKGQPTGYWTFFYSPARWQIDHC
jgi:hypothetical protein